MPRTQAPFKCTYLKGLHFPGWVTPHSLEGFLTGETPPGHFILMAWLSVASGSGTSE